MTRRHIALITPWFGVEQKGGAEQLAWQLAHRLLRAGHLVEVLTTCARGLQSEWGEDYFKAGEQLLEGLPVQRFSVRPRDISDFAMANAELFREAPDHSERERTRWVSAEKAFVSENIHSPDLIAHLDTKRSNYDVFLFLPYLYGVVLSGVHVAPAKTILIPCLHDEPYARLSAVFDAMAAAAALAFNSEGELELAKRLFGPMILPRAAITGVGVERPEESQRNVERELPEKFLLCLGRRTREKGVDFLVRMVRSLRSKGANMALVLAGPGGKDYSDAEGTIVDLGLVDEASKSWLIGACHALVQPSQNESFSRTIYEAWQAGKPVLVHAECAATRIPVERSGGGWVSAGTDTAWIKAISDLWHADGPELDRRGENGRAYGAEHAEWRRVIERYEALIDRVCDDTKRAPMTRDAGKGEVVHQVVASLVRGDAISAEALWIRACLQKWGLQSEIYAESRSPDMRDKVKLLSESRIPAQSPVIYHHSIHSAATDAVCAHDGRIALLYHNITPAHFFDEYDAKIADLLSNGRSQLGDLVDRVDLVMGDSQFNCLELEETGFSNPRCLPLPVDPERWRVAPALDLDWRLSDGRTNILFVGRVAPNKCQHDLLSLVSEFRQFDPSVRLVLVGKYGHGDRYYRKLRGQIRREGLSKNVLLLNGVGEAALHACYRQASLYVSMSEHEGFGVPLVEAMAFDIPVLAYDCTAVGETLKDGAILFDDKSDMCNLAKVALALAHIPSTRESLVAAQRRRVKDFSPARVEELLHSLVGKFGIELPELINREERKVLPGEYDANTAAMPQPTPAELVCLADKELISPDFYNARKALLKRSRERKPRISSFRLLRKTSDRDFLENAYQAILGRPPDSDHYLDWIGEYGTPRGFILAVLRLSPEGRSRNVHVVGLSIVLLLAVVARPGAVWRTIQSRRSK